MLLWPAYPRGTIWTTVLVPDAGADAFCSLRRSSLTSHSAALKSTVVPGPGLYASTLAPFLRPPSSVPGLPSVLRPGFGSVEMCSAMAVSLVDGGSLLPARRVSPERQGSWKGDGQAGALSKPSGVPGLPEFRTATGAHQTRLP